MQLSLFRSLWTLRGNLAAALEECQASEFDGIEGPVPLNPKRRETFTRELRTAAVPYIAEITTGGGYVPDAAASPEWHLEDFRRKAEASLEGHPLFLTVLAGSDAWPLAQSVDFLGRLLAIAGELGVDANIETHRSRILFHPWITCEILTQLPELRLTCDFSHWCCVCERLVLEEEPELLALCAQRARHIHARVGYDQGAQVPHPAAPEFAQALTAHERWWAALWEAQEDAGCPLTTMTPESGPDGYLHTLPFTGMPVADLDEINRWMAARQRRHFAGRHPSLSLSK